MKTFLIIVLLSFCSEKHTPLNYRKLSWKDFCAKPDKKSGYTASSHTTIDWYYVQLGDSVSKFYAEATFDPDRSWTKDNNLLTLKHEQGHFDICQAVCIAFNSQRKYYPDRISFSDYEKIQKYFNELWNEWDAGYDGETRHSLNREAQERWNKWIAGMLKAQ